MQVLLTSCWFEVQGKHSISCSRPPPDASTSTGAWNLGEKWKREGREEKKRRGGGKGRENGRKERRGEEGGGKGGGKGGKDGRKERGEEGMKEGRIGWKGGEE